MVVRKIKVSVFTQSKCVSSSPTCINVMFVQLMKRALTIPTSRERQPSIGKKNYKYIQEVTNRKVLRPKTCLHRHINDYNKLDF